jgi:phosphate transport system permease protein
MGRKRFIEEKVFNLLMVLATLLVLAILFNIVYAVLKRGLPAMSWDMITKVPSGGFYLGGEGGLLNAILGSVYIVFASTFLGLLVSIPVVFYLNIYRHAKSRFASFARLAYDVLFGIPSIVYGAFGFVVMVYLGMKASLLSGIVVVTLLIVPILIRSMDEVAQRIPRDIVDAAFSLGATRLETIRVVLRQIAPGIATAVLLSAGRAIGDAACVLFTAGYTDSVPTSLGQPAATLPLAIFFQLSSPSEDVQNRAYAAAFILTVIVLLLSVLGRFFTNRFNKNSIR